jgi:NAD-dependent deacetylase
MMGSACRVASKADIFVVIGSSLVVYPAASLLEYAPIACPKFIIDPNIPNVEHINNITAIQATAVNGMKILLKKLVDENN